ELREGLRELGQTEGQTFRIESRSAESNAARLSELAAELTQLKVDVIAAIFAPCALAAKEATASIPIVMVSVGDPVGTGLVASLARPGGNITGLSNMAPETAAKSVELFRDMLPSLRRVGATPRIHSPSPSWSRFNLRAALAASTSALSPWLVAQMRSMQRLRAWQGRVRKPSWCKASSFPKRLPILQSNIACRPPQSCVRSCTRAALSPMVPTPLTSFGAVPCSCTRLLGAPSLK